MTTGESFKVLDDLSRMIQLDSGAVRKVFSLSGAPVIALGDFFTSPDDVFLAFGKEIPSVDDFVLDTDGSCFQLSPYLLFDFCL